GETFSEEKKDFSLFFGEIKTLIERYGKENIYNMDETGIFYKTIPSKSVCNKSRKGFKNFKDRVSIMLCCNMNGKDRLHPLIIGKSKKPRCFKKFSDKTSVDYTSSRRAWMTSEIFNDWLSKWNTKLKKNNKKILLLLDNCPAHKCRDQLSQIELMFLPKNSTGELQPLDNGIIRTFKANFEKYKLNFILEKVENEFGVYESYKKPNLVDVITFSDLAWSDVSEKTILNCFNSLIRKQK
ncbi:Tigger transposable element-derived protein 6, partial [Cucumispora dikerogammari]